MKHWLKRSYDIDVKYARPPGGFARSETITALETELGLTTVIGTAYPLDADMCKCRNPHKLGTCAATMARGGGRIVILHDTANLVAKVEGFLTQAVDEDQLRVVTLVHLLEDIRDRPIAVREIPRLHL